MAEPSYPSLCQINTRLWLTELSQGLYLAEPQWKALAFSLTEAS
jgi:hypothetical protein